MSVLLLIIPHYWRSACHRIIHQEGYTVEEREQYRSVVFSNTILSMIAIIKALNQLNIPFGDKQRLVS